MSIVPEQDDIQQLFLEWMQLISRLMTTMADRSKMERDKPAYSVRSITQEYNITSRTDI